MLASLGLCRGIIRFIYPAGILRFMPWFFKPVCSGGCLMSQGIYRVVQEPLPEPCGVRQTN